MFHLGNALFYFQVLLTYALLSYKTRNKNHYFPIILALGTIFLAIIGVLPSFGVYRFYYQHVIAVLCVIFIGMATSGKPFKNILSHVFTALVVQNLINNICRLIFASMIEGYTTEFLIYNNLLYPVLMVVFYFVFIRYMNNVELEINTAKLITVGIAGGLQSLWLSNFLPFVSQTQLGQMMLYVLFCIFDMCLLIIEFSMFEVSKAQEEKKTLDVLLQVSEQRIKFSKDSIDMINIIYHDLRHQLNLLGAEAGVEKTVFVQEVEQAFAELTLTAKTGNPYIDTILTEKGLQCASHNIKLHYMVDGKQFDFLSPAEVCSLFGNAIDNAIEASQKVPEQEKRIIIVNAYKYREFLILRCENYFNREVKYDIDGIPISTKEGEGIHGYGIKSMRHIVSKHGGDLKIGIENEIFNLSILFPLADNDQS